MKRIAINGMGRIGRLVARSLIASDDVELVAVNDVAPMKTIAYLLAHSTEYGALGKSVSFVEDEGTLMIGESPSKHFANPTLPRCLGDSLESTWFWNAAGRIARAPKRRRISMQARRKCSSPRLREATCQPWFTA